MEVPELVSLVSDLCVIDVEVEKVAVLQCLFVVDPEVLWCVASPVVDVVRAAEVVELVVVSDYVADAGLDNELPHLM